MARTRSMLFCDIWANPDWLRLTSRAQRLYLLLLSQPRLTLAGSLDLRISRWAALAEDSTVDGINGALVELEQATFVVVDWDTEELVIRSFTRHDLAPSRVNQNLLKGMWSAWHGIASPRLRAAVIDNIPEDLWIKAAEWAPSAALDHNRRCTPIELPVPTTGSNYPSEPPTSFPPSTELPVRTSGSDIPFDEATNVASIHLPALKAALNGDADAT